MQLRSFIWEEKKKNGRQFCWGHLCALCVILFFQASSSLMFIFLFQAQVEHGCVLKMDLRWGRPKRACALWGSKFFISFSSLFLSTVNRLLSVITILFLYLPFRRELGYLNQISISYYGHTRHTIHYKKLLQRKL